MRLDDGRDSPTPEPHVVLVVDDDPAVAAVASAYLERRLQSVETLTATSARGALDRIEDASIDCLVSDYRMPDLDGLELYERVSARHPDLPFILFTSVGRDDVRRQADGAGVSAFVEKDGSTDTFETLTTHVRQVAIRGSDGSGTATGM